LGQQVLPTIRQTQASGVELNARITTTTLPSGVFSVVASYDGNVISSTQLSVTH